MRQRVGALIIQDKKLLLVTGKNAGYYWTPGGTIDDGETQSETLVRELHEELGVKLKSYESYIDLEYPNDNVRSHFYLVQIEGELKPDNEVQAVFRYTKANFMKKEPAISTWLIDEVLPKLIKDGLL